MAKIGLLSEENIFKSIQCTVWLFWCLLKRKVFQVHFESNIGVKIQESVTANTRGR